MLLRNVLAALQEENGLHKVADHFLGMHPEAGGWRENICVMSLQLTTSISSLSPCVCFGCHHQICLWDVTWGCSHVLMHWVMSYGLYTPSFEMYFQH